MIEPVEWDYAPDAQFWCGGMFFKKKGDRWYWKSDDRLGQWDRTPYADPSNFSWWGDRLARPTGSTEVVCSVCGRSLEAKP